MKKNVLFIITSCLSSQIIAPAYAMETIETIYYNFEDDMMQEINKETGEYDVLSDDNISPLLEKQYRDLITESYKNGVVLDISLEEYIGTMNEEVNYNDYILEKKSEGELLNNAGRTLENISYASRISTLRSSSSSDKYYYNTGTSCPASATYGSTRLLSMASTGDLVYEAAGGFGITGHIAVVEGRYWDPVGKRYYIRVVEAVSDGVCRGILDDKRYAEKCAYLLKFSSNSGVDFTTKQKAVDFCLGELGKSYGFGTTQSDWYCSELAWTAYGRQNIYIGSKSDGLILPYAMYMSSKTISINVYK